ncbi:MAG: hypothetical protein FWE36_08750 [Erysipelotrichales bacterium]|nr:hypothetical protein [Erysipelotrichales bacterium]
MADFKCPKCGNEFYASSGRTGYYTESGIVIDSTGKCNSCGNRFIVKGHRDKFDREKIIDTIEFEENEFSQRAAAESEHQKILAKTRADEFKAYELMQKKEKNKFYKSWFILFMLIQLGFLGLIFIGFLDLPFEPQEIFAVFIALPVGLSLGLNICCCTANKKLMRVTILLMILVITVVILLLVERNEFWFTGLLGLLVIVFCINGIHFADIYNEMDSGYGNSFIRDKVFKGYIGNFQMHLFISSVIFAVGIFSGFKFREIIINELHNGLLSLFIAIVGLIYIGFSVALLIVSLKRRNY